MYRFGVIYAFQKKECHQFEKYEISNERIGKMSVGSGEFYIGSTISPVARWKRYQDDIKSMRPKSIRCVTKYIFQNGGIKNFNFIILEDFPCESSEELHTRESQWIDRLSPSLNEKKPRQTVVIDKPLLLNEAAIEMLNWRPATTSTSPITTARGAPTPSSSAPTPTPSRMMTSSRPGHAWKNGLTMGTMVGVAPTSSMAARQ